MILGLFPDLVPAGGVQRVGRHIAAVLSAVAGERDEAVSLLTLNDSFALGRGRVGAKEFAFTGFGRAKWRFVRAALEQAREDPRLILAGHVNLAPVAAAARGVARGARVFVVAHGIEVWQPLPSWRRLALQRADCVLAPSRYTARKVAEAQGLPEGKVVRLPWALDPEFAAGACLERSRGAPQPDHLPAGYPAGRVVLAVTRLTVEDRYKGVDTLLRGWPQVAAAVADAHLAIVGDGDDRRRLEQLAAELGLAPRVHFLGLLDREALHACYARSDVFALPSTGEGFGLVFLEAMAFSKPVVGCAAGGATDVVADGAGLLVPPGDTAALAAALARLLNEENLRAEMGRRARARVEQHYRFERFEAELRQLLDERCAS